MKHTIETNFNTIKSFRKNRLLNNIKFSELYLLPGEFSILDRITFVKHFEKENTINKLYRKIILTEYKEGKPAAETKIKL